MLSVAVWSLSCRYHLQYNKSCIYNSDPWGRKMANMCEEWHLFLVNVIKRKPMQLCVAWSFFFFFFSFQSIFFLDLIPAEYHRHPLSGPFICMLSLCYAWCAHVDVITFCLLILTMNQCLMHACYSCCIMFTCKAILLANWLPVRMLSVGVCCANSVVKLWQS